MENTRALSARRDMFLDERGSALRVTWHPERDLVVLSVWQDDRCVGTFRMSVLDVPRLSALLAAALGDWVDQADAVPVAGGGWEAGGDPNAVGGSAAGSGWERGSSRGGEHEDRDQADRDQAGRGRAGGSGSARSADGTSLSVPQRLRLSRPVLKLRGLQHRRRRSA